MIDVTKILNYITFAFLGIEEFIWNKIDTLEKQKFYRVTIFVLILSVITILGMYEFFMLLLNNPIIAITLGILFSLVVINIFRFSIFTIQNPIYYEPKIETNITDKQNSISTPTENSDSQLNTSATFLSSVKNVLFKVLHFFSFELFTRVSINGILILFIVLPFACFINQDDIDKINSEKRIQLIQTFKENQNANFASKSNSLDLKIKKLRQKNDFNQNTIYTSELKNELLLKKKLLAEWNEEKQNVIFHYEKNIANKNFIIYSYRFIENKPIFWFALIMVSFLFIVSHIQKHMLLHPTNKYYILANTYYRELALEHYNNSESQIKETLQKKYKSNIYGIKILNYYESLIANSFYTDPPFNSKMKEYKIRSKKLSTIEFINSFSAK
jgi:hypothetical protein